MIVFNITGFLSFAVPEKEEYEELQQYIETVMRWNALSCARQLPIRDGIDSRARAASSISSLMTLCSSRTMTPICNT
jgi:hypothetical protein